MNSDKFAFLEEFSLGKRNLNGPNGSTVMLFDRRSITAAAESKPVEFDSMVALVAKETAESFGLTFDEKGSDGTRNHLIDADALGVWIHDDNFAGFASARHFVREEVFYLHGVAIANSAKGKSGSKRLVQTLIETGPPSNRIAYTTQNPVMHCFMRSFCDTTYPSPTEPVVPIEFRPLAPILLAGRDGTPDEQSFVIRDLYKKCLYPGLPQSQDEQINAWFGKSLRAQNGITRDGFLLVGPLRK